LYNFRITIMKEVLIVDDFTPTLKSIKSYLSGKYADEIMVYLAENGEQATKMLNANEIDLVVTDIGMPVMDGLDLLAYMSKKHPEIPVIIMTSFGTPQIEERLKEFRAFLYLEKPFDITTLEEKILEGLKAETEGHVKGFSLPSFLQLIQMESKTCTLKVFYDNNKATLYFKDGALIGAKTPDKTGKEAALEILSLEKAEIDIDGKCREFENEIDIPLHYLLLESARLQDEKKKENKEINKDEEINTLEYELVQEIENELFALLNLNIAN
jgi:CheY-like chemotaxis protein